MRNLVPRTFLLREVIIRFIPCVGLPSLTPSIEYLCGPILRVFSPSYRHTEPRTINYNDLKLKKQTFYFNYYGLSVYNFLFTLNGIHFEIRFHTTYYT